MEFEGEGRYCRSVDEAVRGVGVWGFEGIVVVEVEPLMPTWLWVLFRLFVGG